MAHKRRDKGKAGSRERISRRVFLGLGASALGGWLAGCWRATVAPTAVPTSIPAAEASPTPPASPTPTPAPFHTLTPTPAPTLPLTYTPVPATPTVPPSPTAKPAPALSRAALMAHWPATDTSRVVIVRHSGVWAGSELDPDIVHQMLDAGVSTLTGVSDALAVWRTLFDPDERVLLKVNCISYAGPTQLAVTYAGRGWASGAVPRGTGHRDGGCTDAGARPLLRGI
jgi:hypothetical protein